MDLTDSKFNRIFLKNLFIEILNEKATYPEKTLSQMCEILADAYITEFDSGETPTKILSHHKSVEKWLMKKVQSFAHDN